MSRLFCVFGDCMLEFMLEVRQKDSVILISIRNSPRQLACREFCRGISMFLSICLGKKNAKAFEFVGILKKTFPRIKMYIFLLKKECIYYILRSVLRNEYVDASI